MKPGVRRLIEELRGARVLVIHPRDAEGEALIDQLKRIGCNVRGVWPPPATIPDVDADRRWLRLLRSSYCPTATSVTSSCNGRAPDRQHGMRRPSSARDP